MWEEMRVRSEDAAERDKVRINQKDKRKGLEEETEIFILTVPFICC